MTCIAITGGIACGKSTLSRHLEECGADVIDTDAVTHALQAPGGEATGPIARAFGGGVIGTDGGVDRRRLGERVFADPAARERLNAIVHPLVREKVAEWRRRPAPGRAFKAAVVPLFYEAGWDADGWDGVVCVTCGEAEQLRRLAARGLTPEDARRRVAAQMPVGEKACRAQWVVANDGPPEALRAEARELARRVLERKA
jgi:dephospho-CoA kinase